MSEAKKYFDSAKIKYDRGDYTGAIADYDKAIELDPNYALAYMNRGIAKAQKLTSNNIPKLLQTWIKP